MFGLLDIRMCSLGTGVQRHYTCGVCDALASGYGVAARSMLSRDAVYLSLLTSAQMEGALDGKYLGGRLSARRCRPWSRAGPSAPEFAFPAAASVVAYCGLLMDKLHDEPCLTASVGYAISRGKMRAADARLRGFGLSLPMDWLVARQHSAEAGGAAEGFSRVTEGIYSALFSHSAVVAGVPGNAPGLAEVGRHVGRMAYLVDGYVDAEADRRRGSFNACSAMASALGISGAVRLREEVESRAEGSLAAIRRAMSTVRLRSNDAQIRHSLGGGLQRRVNALMALGIATAKPRRYYLFSLAPVAIFMVKGLAGVSQDDYCCSTDCLTCGVSEEDCCGAAVPPGSEVPTGAVASAAYGGVGAIVGAGVGILASGIGWPSAPSASTPGATADVASSQSVPPPPEFMQQWGPPPPGQAAPYERPSYVDWRDDWYDVSEENMMRQRGLTPGEALREILEGRPAWMRDYDHPGPDGYTDFEYHYGNARYLTPDEVAKLPPDKKAEYDSWKERYASWYRRHYPKEGDLVHGASRG